MHRPGSTSFLIVLLCSLLFVQGADGQSLDWARGDGGADNDGAQAISVDSLGNSYIIGTFVNNATFGAGEANETVLTSAGAVVSQDIFIAKYDAAGNLVWALGIGATDPASGGDAGTDNGWGIVTDSGGNSYITGSLYRFASRVNVGGVVLENPAGDPGLVPGAFAAKFDPNGNAIWATTLELPNGASTSGGQGLGIDIDGLGNSYIAGEIADPVLGGSAVTIWKLDPDGSPLWVRQATVSAGAPTALGTAISVDSAGNSYVTGRVQSGAYTFGRGEPNETDVTDIDGTSETFVAKYDSLGNLLWARQSDDIVGSFSFGTGIATDDGWNVYVVGNGPTTLDGILVGGSPTLVWIAKYDTAGNLLWVKSSSQGEIEAISTTPSGHSYVTGLQSAAMTFGFGEANETTLPGRGIFIAKYDPDGGFLWATNGIVDLFAAGWGIALDNNDHPHVTGAFRSTLTLGPGEDNETVLENDGSGFIDFDSFVARYIDLDSVPPPPVLAAAKTDQLLIDSNGNGLVDPGERLRYVVTLNNTGGAATGVSFTDTPDSSTTLVSGSVTTTQGTVVTGNTGGDSLVAIDLGTVGPGDTATIVFDVDILAPLPAGVNAVANQGVFFSPGVFEVWTDDPDDPASQMDATVTPVQPSPPPSLLDLDIARFQTRNRVSVSRAQSVDIKLVIENTTTLNGVANATVIGIQGGIEVYRATAAVSDSPGNGRTTFDFPLFAPTVAGVIAWTATIDDPDPDIDEAVASTTVVP